MSTNTTLSSITAEACAALVQHYSDPIHFAAADNEINNSHHQSTTNDNDNAAPPYFDTPTPGSSKPMPNLAPVCGYWYKRLVEASTTASSSITISSDDTSVSSSKSMKTSARMKVKKDVKPTDTASISTPSIIIDYDAIASAVLATEGLDMATILGTPSTSSKSSSAEVHSQKPQKEEMDAIKERARAAAGYIPPGADGRIPTMHGQLPLDDVARELICCYESTIHPLVKRCNIMHVSSKDSADNNSSSNDNNGTDISENKVPLNATLVVLKHYELLLAHIMKDASSSTAANSTMPVAAVGETTATTDENDCSNDNNIIEVSHFVPTEPFPITSSSIKPTTTKDLSSDVLGRMVHIIANDIFHWSTKLPTRKKNNASLWKVQNILLPTLLRLIEHTVVILAAYRNNKPNTNNKSTLLLSKETKEAMAIATIVAIPFVGDGILNSGVFGIGSLLEWVESAKDNSASAADKSSLLPSQLSLAHTLQQCSPSPIISKGEGSNDATYLIPPLIMSSDFMTRSVVDLSVPAAYFDDAPWTDSGSGIGSRVAMALLRTVQQQSTNSGMSSLIEEVGSSTRKASLWLILCNISQYIGVDILASTIRAHFFGRLSHSSSYSSNAITKPQSSGAFMPLIQRRGDSSVNNRTAAKSVASDEKPHTVMPMRLSAAAVLLCAIIPQPIDDFEVMNKAISDTIPIVLTLLDDIKTIHQATGALILISVIEAASSSSKLGNIPSFVEQFHPVITSSLEEAIKTCGRDAPVMLTMMCLAQSKWVQYFECYSKNPGTTISPSQVPTLARKSLTSILLAVGKQVHEGGRDDNDERLAGAFVAGINPLLAQLAHLPNAAAIEVTRLGLTTILPLIGWCGMRLEVRSGQIAALAGLVSLMNGAYTIMLLHHGKKIMTEVFLLMDRTDKDAKFMSEKGGSLDEEVSTAATSKVALYVAAISHAICGKSAEEILHHVETTRLSKEHLMKRIHDIRAISEELKGGQA